MVDVSISEFAIKLAELDAWLSDTTIGKSVVNNSVDDDEGVNVANGIRSPVGDLSTVNVSVMTMGAAADPVSTKDGPLTGVF